LAGIAAVSAEAAIVAGTPAAIGCAAAAVVAAMIHIAWRRRLRMIAEAP
jgi:hypothetical protein